MTTVSSNGFITYRYEDYAVLGMYLRRNYLDKVPREDHEFNEVAFGMLPKYFRPMVGNRLNSVVDFSQYPLHRLMRSVDVCFGLDLSDYLCTVFEDKRNADTRNTLNLNAWNSPAMIVENRYYYAENYSQGVYANRGGNPNLCYWRPLTDGYSYKIRVGMFKAKLSLIENLDNLDHMSINELLCTDLSPLGSSQCIRYPESATIDWTDERMSGTIPRVRDIYKDMCKLIDYKEVWLGTAPGYQTTAHLTMKDRVDAVKNYESYKDEWFYFLIIQQPTVPEFDERNHSCCEKMATWDTSIDYRALFSYRLTTVEVMQYL